MLNKYILIPILILINSLQFLSCTDKSVAPTSIELTLLESIPIEIKEPSDLTFNNDKAKLWIVGDADPQIYLTDLRGNIEKKYFVSKQDLEGITSIGDSILAVVVEKSREILFLNLKDNSENVYQTGLEGEVNNGLEGITNFPTEENLFISNEKNPKLILKTNFNAEILSYTSIDFTEDLAGLYFDQSDNTLWVLSQEGNMIYKCNTEYKIIEQYSIPNNQYEGIAINGKNIYLVSDTEQLLSTYLIP